MGMSADLARLSNTTRTELPSGVWTGLLQHALRLVEDIHQNGIKNPFWTFGGGTVLMLRYQHRVSKDIDIFVPDPQYLGFVSPRLSDIAEEVSVEYVEGNGFVKLIRPEGEIVAKKLWHRGDRVSARDLFDLSLVIEREPEALVAVSSYLIRHRSEFLEQLQSRSEILTLQFDAIDVLAYRPSYKEAAKRAAEFLRSL